LTKHPDYYMLRWYKTKIKGEEVREEIFYEYVKLISRSVYDSLQRGFITGRFQKLRDGEISISGTMREWEKEKKIVMGL